MVWNFSVLRYLIDYQMLRYLCGATVRSCSFGGRAYSNDLSTSVRLALFGTDRFALHSLKALSAAIATRKDEFTLDLVTRHPKPSGRGRKTIKDCATAEWASTNNVPVKRADSDDEINSLQGEYDLTVAVSYGKLIPAAFLKSCRFGGLNVHPSLLPSLSGAAPLHRALLNRDAYTGVTVQTLHPTKFDRGMLLAQSEEIPIASDETLQTLTDKLGQIGADLLVKVVLSGMYQNPSSLVNNYGFSWAKKIRTDEKKLSFEKADSDTIYATYRTFGSVHSSVKTKSGLKKIIFYNLSPVISQDTNARAPGDVFLSKERSIVECASGSLSFDAVQLEGYPIEDPVKFANSLRKRGILKADGTERLPKDPSLMMHVA